MERIEPINFQGPRAYFTDFDYKIVRFKHNKKEYRKEVERRLKIILLTKNTVVCAASHLSHEFAYNIFKDNPILLTENMILPALRMDKEHITDYLDGKRIKGYIKEDMRQFYEYHVDKVINWELIENSAWFKENILKALNNDNSVIRRNLANLPDAKLDTLINEIVRNDILTRELILKNTSTWLRKEQKTALNFVNLVYHMSGARVVNCESALPQESYIDYSLTDFSRHRVMLSDTQVFLKIFFELAFETLHKNTYSVESLDALSFEDIYYLKKPLENSSFQRKYDELIQTCTQTLRNSETSSDVDIYNMEKTLEILECISETFEELFKQELPNLLEKRNIETTKELRKSTLSLGLGIAGFIPIISNIASVLGLCPTLQEFYINVNQWFKSKKEKDDYELYLKNKDKTLHQMIEKYSISEKATLLDTLNLITNTISERNKLLY